MEKTGLNTETMPLWTRQVPQVWDELNETGQYIVKKEYIEAKNDTISDYYIRLYKWYTREARKHMTIPDELEFPVWLSVSDDNMLQPVENTIILELEVPKSEVLICNYDAWGYIVNYWYIPLNDADASKHQAELKRYGLASDDELFLTNKGNFYPQLKRKVLDSWSRVFTMAPETQAAEVATMWRIKKEWVKHVYRFVDGSDASGH